MGKRLTTEQFIKKSIEVHGDSYTYEHVDYVNYSSNVIITCPIHGKFTQTPSNHLSGCGCITCGGREQLTFTTFVDKAEIKHNGIYDYSKVQYQTAHIPVIIICKKHGNFSQLPYIHLQGSGCAKCVNLQQLTTPEFIDKAELEHVGMYTYEKVQYTNTCSKVTITCPIHGEFHQTPNNHLSGYGCSKCGTLLSSNKSRSSTDEFISKSKLIHGTSYDYTNVEYNATHKKVTILCPIHGDFQQKPNTHLSGHGCRMCNNIGGYTLNKLTTDTRLGQSSGYLYLIRLTNDQECFYKIGITRQLKSRLSCLTPRYVKEMVSCVELRLLNAFIIEQNIIYQHHTYTPQHYFAGHTECMILDNNELELLTDLINILDDTCTFNLMNQY